MSQILEALGITAYTIDEQPLRPMATQKQSGTVISIMPKEFKEFAMCGNVVDMAVGIIIGALLRLSRLTK